MTAQQAGTFMRAFGDGTRLRIIAALGVRPLTVGELARLVRCPVQRMSRHLRYLYARGVVDWKPAGKAVAYRLSPPAHALHRRVLAAVGECLTTLGDVQRDAGRLRAKPRR